MIIIPGGNMWLSGGFGDDSIISYQKFKYFVNILKRDGTLIY